MFFATDFPFLMDSLKPYHPFNDQNPLSMKTPDYFLYLPNHDLVY